jgi:hypothetical protein
MQDRVEIPIHNGKLYGCGVIKFMRLIDNGRIKDLPLNV